jgi:GTP-binding protein
MAFLDEAVVEFRSGSGGSGAVSFHREKHVPRGGPNGEDGGRGGDVVLVASRGVRTLAEFELTPIIAAESGTHASGNKRGRNGRSVIVEVPVGTVVHDAETGEVIVDLVREKMKFVLCRGGRGGHGNRHYVSSVRQAPNFAEKGAPGERRRVRLELKLLADVGLVGMPNAGKSTLLAAVTSARPKVGAYPFTTTTPNLGVAKVGDRTLLIADLPGLIEGASQGHGLGHAFLRHVERTQVLVHVVDAWPVDGSDPVQNYELVEKELREFSETLWQKPRIIALNKADLIPPHELGPLRERFAKFERPTFVISGATGQGLQPLLFEALALLDANRPPEPEELEVPYERRSPEASWNVRWEKDRLVVTGEKVERMVAMTPLENRDALRYLHRRLERMGVIEKLRELGAKEGDTVVVGDTEFAFTDLA